MGVMKMTNEEAIKMFKAIIMAEIERLPHHYDAEVDDVVYDDISSVDELLQLNKIVSKALKKQIPKKPSQDSIGLYYFPICPNCHKELESYDHHCECGQALDWKGVE